VALRCRGCGAVVPLVDALRDAVRCALHGASLRCVACGRHAALPAGLLP
jgi:hypothetical protein